MWKLVDCLEILLELKSIIDKSPLLVIYLDTDVILNGCLKLGLQYLDHLVRLVVLSFPVWQLHLLVNFFFLLLLFAIPPFASRR